jgi:hypothetical protein
MLLDLLPQHQLGVLGAQRWTVLPHVEVVLLLLQGSHLFRLYFSLLVKSLKDTVDASLGYDKELIEYFWLVEVELQLGHHLFDQF